jgi:thiol-disulfide isomerase/thioredoxin
MLTRLSLRNLVFVTALALCLGLGIRLAAHRYATAASQAADSTEELALEPFPIPEGDAEKLLEFVQELLGEQKEFETDEEQKEYVLRALTTQIAVAEKILGEKDLTDDLAEKAAQLKMQGHVNLAVMGVPKGMERAVAAVRALAKDKRPIITKFAKNNDQVVRIICLGGLSPEDRDELITEVLDELEKRKFAQRVLKKAQMLGESLEEAGDRERMMAFYAKLAAGMTATGNENLIGQAQRIEGQLRRFKLPGSLMEIEGTTLAGEKFDWEAYRGKVVLVDYWATWCGPCLQELPHVKKMYKKYHKQGFDVVGISLDDDKEKLEEFLKDEKIQWTTLLEPDVNQRGWETPLAVKYGVSGIPMAILVDKAGKVVSLSARGEELTRLLEELLGAKE